MVGVFWGNHTRDHPNYMAQTQSALEGLWAEGKIRPEVSQTWPLAELPHAMHALAARKVLGKAVVVI